MQQSALHMPSVFMSMNVKPEDLKEASRSWTIRSVWLINAWAAQEVDATKQLHPSFPDLVPCSLRDGRCVRWRRRGSPAHGQFSVKQKVLGLEQQHFSSALVTYDIPMQYQLLKKILLTIHAHTFPRTVTLATIKTSMLLRTSRTEQSRYAGIQLWVRQPLSHFQSPSRIL